MELQLQSNYRDWYDFAFERQGEVYRRFDYEGPNRRQMLVMFETSGLPVPRHGLVRDLIPRLAAEFDPQIRAQALLQVAEVVVYLDESQHAGEGKIKVQAAEALERYPDHYASEFHTATPNGKGKTFRYLQVGNRRWWLLYWSEDDWRSNAGDCDCRLLCEEVSLYDPLFRYPMFAIDFLPKDNAPYWAIDFNLAPGLKPLQGLVSGSEIVDLLAVAVRSFRVPLGQGVCRVCGCTDLDCSGCIARTGVRCYWIEPHLCSACAPVATGKKADQ